MSKLELMQAFCEVVKHGSFAAAAKELRIANSAMTKRVQDLESLLGVKLLNRTTRTVVMTAAGAAYYDEAQRILEDVQNLESAIMDEDHKPEGLLRVAAPLSFGIHVLGPVLGTFQRNYPDIKIDLSLSDRRVDLLEEGFDVGLSVGRLRDSSLIAKKLCASKHMVVAAPAYFKQHEAPQHPQDLKAHACLLYSYANRPDRWSFVVGGDRQYFSVQGSLSANNGDVLLASALQGRGLARLPQFLVKPFVARGQLVEVLADYQATDEGVYALYPPNRYLSAKMKAFLGFLEAHLKVLGNNS